MSLRCRKALYACTLIQRSSDNLLANSFWGARQELLDLAFALLAESSFLGGGEAPPPPTKRARDLARTDN
jgi:hypothetical protein